MEASLGYMKLSIKKRERKEKEKERKEIKEKLTTPRDIS